MLSGAMSDFHLFVAELGVHLDDLVCKRCGFAKREIPKGKGCNGSLADELTTELLDHGYMARDKSDY